MTTVLASANAELDELLNHVVAGVQLTSEQFRRANRSYQTITDWLQADQNPVAEFDPTIFPQGSLQLDTTVRPLAHAEFDLDLVCLLKHPSVDPMVVYGLLLDRMEDHGTYAPIVTPERRCIRLNYAGDFHLDIVPAIAKPYCRPGETCILIPDREKKVWRPSNPKGYTAWFESRTPVSKRASIYERAAEPLHNPVPVAAKAPLKLAVQLLKRWRDVRFKDRIKRAPSSIVLTTLAGRLYNGEHHPTDALMNILDGICSWANRENIRLKNPSNDDEWITECWNEDHGLNLEFLEAVADFRQQWHWLISTANFQQVIKGLKEIFEEHAIARGIEKLAESRRHARNNGTLRMDRSSGLLGIGPVIGAGALSVKRHTFHGG